VGIEFAVLDWPLTLLIVLAGVAPAGSLGRWSSGCAVQKCGKPRRPPSQTCSNPPSGRTPIGIGFADRELRFVRVNKAFAQYNGISRKAHVGRPVKELIPARRGRWESRCSAECWKLASRSSVWHVRLGEPGGRESNRDFYGNVFPVRGPWGGFYG
jgi:hypothetical protein